MDELTKMGAKFSLDGDLLLLYGDGDSHFKGNTVKAVDLRGGMACLLMSLVSKGETKITNFSQVLRGYDKLEEKLNILLS
jgi:UDP-N-acetylglucosamine 1-carboxyvinyltransferase